MNAINPSAPHTNRFTPEIIAFIAANNFSEQAFDAARAFIAVPNS